MDPRSLTDLGFLQWASAARTIPGEMESGDIGVVEKVSDGALIAVIDGLGHGSEAAKAANVAEKKVRECAGEYPALIIEHCHQALKGTRGAVITVAHVNERQGTLAWIGVGNVEGRIWTMVPGRSLVRQAPPLRGGVVGHHLPKLNTSTLPLVRGDLIVLSTDGIRNDFHDQFRLVGTVKQIANEVAKDYWSGTDDALVLVARYLGSS
ncbi:MAG TPA: SpoIIE family protein phosphatase [Actinomycetota bacterium]|nr:SpoIIE family protein phosphatase [Actinomycetota bacterium]